MMLFLVAKGVIAGQTTGLALEWLVLLLLSVCSRTLVYLFELFHQNSQTLLEFLVFVLLSQLCEALCERVVAMFSTA